MATTLKNINELFKETINEVSRNSSNWQSFLNCAAMNYKYNFPEQLLIFAQKPTATACADCFTWNNILKRYLNKDCIGIALLTEISGYPRLRYVFDVSDTHSIYGRYGEEITLWTISKSYEDMVMQSLHNKYDITVNDNIKEVLKEYASLLVENSYQDYLIELLKNIKNTTLETFSSDIITEKYKTLLIKSVYYIILKRCGINPSPLFISTDFKNITAFKDLTTIMRLGAGISEIAEMGLREIHSILKNLQMQEINEILTFEKGTKKVYDGSVKTNLVERRNQNENRLHESEWNQSTKYSNKREDRSFSREVWNNEIGILEEPQEERLSSNVNGGHIDRTLEGNRDDSRKQNSIINETNDGERGLDGRIENERPNDVDRFNEQLDSESRGNSEERVNLRLKDNNTDDSVSFYYGEYNDEIDLLNHVLHLHKIDDIKLKIDDNEVIIASDDSNEWIGKEFYDFIFNDLFVYNEDDTVDLIDNIDLDRLKEYRKKYENDYKREVSKANDICDAIHLSFKNSQQKDIKTLKNICISKNMMLDDFLYNQGYADFDEYIDDLEESYKKYSFSGIDFEKKIPHNMRFKEVDILNDNLYWITQEFFNQEDLLEFQKAFRETSFKKAYITTRDLSWSYNFEEDKTNHVLVVLTKEEINSKDYFEAVHSVKVGEELEDEKKEIKKEEDKKTIKDNYIVNNEINQLSLFTEKEPNYVLSQGNGKDNIIVIDDIEPSMPNNRRKRNENIVNYVLHPEVPYEKRINYKITNNNLGVGTSRERFKNNIEAIKILKQCEVENRYSTKEEQEILARYVGWGGLSQAFDKNDSSWSNEYNILKDLLNEEEYKNAFESTLTSFYTPPIIINAMYKALSNMGLNKGNILEPSCGIGNFMGMLPNNDNLKIYGVEIDSISGRIARQLYQKSSIAIKGFEEVNYTDSFFDVVIGNVPFGDMKVNDKRYDKNNFLIHDYFFAKSIDKVRPGGIIALITSKGTMDKPNSNVRKYLASRADLIGAIRLPNNVFKDAAGTTVTSDIIFLQKRDSIIETEPNWVNVGTNYQGITMNNYFIDHPENIMGEMKMITGRFGMESACLPFENKSLEEALNEAIKNIDAKIRYYEIIHIEEEYSIEADLNVNNFSYTIVDDKIYYRENSRMYPQKLSLMTENRVKGLIELRECIRKLINLQLEDYPDDDIKQEQNRLNTLYDDFVKKYGLINSKVNRIAFSNDNSYYLLCSLEILNSEGKLKRKADIFTKRTINPHKEHKIIKDATDALIVSIGNKARVDLDYMAGISHISKEKLVKDLEGKIFKIPGEEKYVTADEYLSGNIREKLRDAELYNKIEPIYDLNIKYLNNSLPEFLHANDISVRLGTTWIPKEDYEEFMFNLLDADNYTKSKIKINYSNNEWSIENKNCANNNIKVTNTYGTKRINAYKIIEETLNLKDVKIFDYFDISGKKCRELNGKETAIAQAKQEEIKQAFQDWIWTSQERRSRLEETYNTLYNSIVPREYDGSNIIFEGMNPEFKLRKHQVNAIARILYGGNTLLAHEVGAGKTFEMVAAAMESKRLGLCNKSLFVIPNHIVEQFASEFLQLYPAANILVATKKDFETANRKKFCSRIATGEYDAIIIGHSQFEKIPMSIERQIKTLEEEIEEITRGLIETQHEGKNFTVKQLAKTQRTLETKLKKLNTTDRKDDNVVTFEQLGVDRLFVDEAHYYKNLYLYTKMSNVSGIAQTEAQKSSDLYMKCKYLDEITGNKGIIFATGTPVSNSMVELYSMQRYLQASTLEKLELQNFDAWASIFGETITALELSADGNGYRAKTRFAKFYNLPELISIFKEVADIQTADVLKLPVPEAKYETVVIQPSEIQLKFMEELSKRAEEIRGGNVDPHEDNMLKITNDGKKIGLDQRLMNDLLPDYENSKVNICANNIYKIYQENNKDKLTQLVFCDISTPKNDGSFNIYDDLREKLVSKGIPLEEIVFIHEAKNDIEKQEIFAKVRNGKIRILIGSTLKMGAGTNCQDRIIAIHHFDCPWKPAEITQRNGRGIRQGNINKIVYIYNYVTEKTFDAYLYQILENKQKFISQIMTSKAPLRSASDVDETALSYAEIKALAAGNPLILEKTDLEMKVSKLKLLKQNYLSQKYELEDKIAKTYPEDICNIESTIEGMSKDLQNLLNFSFSKDKFFNININGINYSDKKEANEALNSVIKDSPIDEDSQVKIGNYVGFDMYLGFNFITKNYYITLKNNHNYIVELGNESTGNITRISNELDRINSYVSSHKERLQGLKNQLELAKKEVEKPFPQENELSEMIKRLKEVDIELKMDENINEVIDDSKSENISQVCKKDYER